MRVAAVATLVITLVCVVAATSLDLFLARRVLWEVDQSLIQRLQEVTETTGLTHQATPAVDRVEGSPVYVWSVSPTGAARSLTGGAPQLPRGARTAIRLPLSLATDDQTFRFESIRYGNGYLVGAENLAAPFHVERVLLGAELVMGPIVLATVFLGVMVISLRSSGPVEAARRRLLELTADASHELRTPLTVIEAEIELARSSPPDSVADREALNHIARESHRLTSIVQDLLWLARFDAGLPMSARPVANRINLGGVVGACAARFEAVASTRRLVLDTRMWPTMVDADPVWVDRLAGTLIDNACRYAPDGGTVIVSVYSEAGRAMLRVDDNGPGIPAGTQLFDRFRRASETPGGAGLGLAIADSVVRSTGGRWKIGRSVLGGASMEVSWRTAGDAPAQPTPEAQRASVS